MSNDDVIITGWWDLSTVNRTLNLKLPIVMLFCKRNLCHFLLKLCYSHKHMTSHSMPIHNGKSLCNKQIQNRIILPPKPINIDTWIPDQDIKNIHQDLDLFLSLFQHLT